MIPTAAWYMKDDIFVLRTSEAKTNHDHFGPDGLAHSECLDISKTWCIDHLTKRCCVVLWISSPGYPCFIRFSKFSYIFLCVIMFSQVFLRLRYVTCVIVLGEVGRKKWGTFATQHNSCNSVQHLHISNRIHVPRCPCCQLKATHTEINTTHATQCNICVPMSSDVLVAILV